MCHGNPMFCFLSFSEVYFVDHVLVTCVPLANMCVSSNYIQKFSSYLTGNTESPLKRQYFNAAKVKK
jgi:hypothetical protein